VSVGLVVEILGDASKLKSELGTAGQSAGGFGASIGGSVLKVAALAGAVGIAANVIADMTTAAADDQAEQARLEAAYAASGAAVGDWAAITDAAIKTAQDKAFSDTEARDALQSLVTTTGDASAAAALLGPAMDIARLSGVDLATAADAVAKANEGQDGALRKLIPGLAQGATAADTLANATAAAAGQADTYASSAAGMQKKGANAFGELSETIGSVFLPILQEILPVLVPIIQSLGELISAVLPIITPLIKIMAKELGVVVSIISTLVGWLIKVITWLTNAAKAVGDFLSSINPFKDIKLPSLPFGIGSSAPATAGVGRSAGATTTGAAPAPATINVFTTGDGIEAEQAIVRALRRVGRINGGVIPAYGWAGSTG
jgi:hypothetical protein